MDDVRTPNDTFAAIDAGAWHQLEQGVTDPQAGFHYVTLCTVSRTGVAQARTVVLRHVSTAERMLEIHTDVRSPKWAELAEQPQATVLGFCNTSRVQLRLQGSVHLFSPDSDVSRAAWKNLSPHTRATYTGGPPGDDLAFPRTVAPNPIRTVRGPAISVSSVSVPACSTGSACSGRTTAAPFLPTVQAARS